MAKRGRRVSGAASETSRDVARRTIRRVHDRAGSQTVASRDRSRRGSRAVSPPTNHASIGETKAVETQRGCVRSARDWALFPRDVPGTAAPATSRSPRNRERMVLRLIAAFESHARAPVSSKMTIRGRGRGVFFSSRTRVLSTLIGGAFCEVAPARQSSVRASDDLSTPHYYTTIVTTNHSQRLAPPRRPPACRREASPPPRSPPRLVGPRASRAGAPRPRRPRSRAVPGRKRRRPFRRRPITPFASRRLPRTSPSSASASRPRCLRRLRRTPPPSTRCSSSPATPAFPGITSGSRRRCGFSSKAAPKSASSGTSATPRAISASPAGSA